MRESDVRKRQGERLKAARIAAGYRSARQAALDNGWNEGTYRAHEGGWRTIGQDDAERYARRFRFSGTDVTAQAILFGEGSDGSPEPNRQVVPVMGRVGAGGSVEPDFEQVPPEGLEEAELPYAIAGDPIGFRVVGDSMYPRYKDGDIVIVEREQPWTVDSMIGDEAIVVVWHEDGSRRFLKRIMPGRKRFTYNLESLDPHAPSILDARIRWASPVRLIVPRLGVRIAPRPQARRATGPVARRRGAS